MNRFIHCNFMEMSELIVIKLTKYVKFVDDYNIILVLIYCIMKMYMISSIIICIT